ncbi:MAG TPA: hypothetical protein VNU97_07820 [Rhizomicrobium sp.]|jgi:hypothetical protein|nr:hypothetical protein [Rhizomicrobium sp.]
MARIEASLRQAGPAATLKRYFDCDNGIGWKLVETGDPRAVKIALAVLPVVDACYGEVMAIELGWAMSNNPALMLGYARQYPDAFADWCYPGLIEPTDAEWNAALAKAERAISGVHDPKLAAARATCLRAIVQARQGQVRP